MKSWIKALGYKCKAESLGLLPSWCVSVKGVRINIQGGRRGVYCSTPCSRRSATSVMSPRKELMLGSSTHTFLPRLCKSRTLNKFPRLRIKRGVLQQGFCMNICNGGNLLWEGHRVYCRNECPASLLPAGTRQESNDGVKRY